MQLSLSGGFLANPKVIICAVQALMLKYKHPRSEALSSQDRLPIKRVVFIQVHFPAINRQVLVVKFGHVAKKLKFQLSSLVVVVVQDSVAGIKR